MRIEPLGEAAFILRDLDQEPYLLAQAIELSLLPGVEEVVPSMNSVGLYVNPNTFRPESLDQLVPVKRSFGKRISVPVVFDGADLSDVCKRICLPEAKVIELFCSATYTVAAIGFLPGFPYLLGLPEEFKEIGRRDSPRIHVPEGSVAIGAGQAGIYPQESPGGWQLLATTPLKIVDVASSYFPITPGDQISFVPTEPEVAKRLGGLTLTEYENR